MRYARETSTDSEVKSRNAYIKSLERIKHFGLMNHIGAEVDAKIKATREKIEKEKRDRKLAAEEAAKKPKEEVPKKEPVKPKAEKKKKVQVRKAFKK